MDYKLMYLPSDDKQIYPFCRLNLLVKIFWTNQSRLSKCIKSFWTKPMNKILWLSNLRCFYLLHEHIKKICHICYLSTIKRFCPQGKYWCVTTVIYDEFLPAIWAPLKMASTRHTIIWDTCHTLWCLYLLFEHH